MQKNNSPTSLGVTTIPTKQSHSTYSIFFRHRHQVQQPGCMQPSPIEVGCTMNFHIIGPICLGPFGFRVWALVVYGPLTTPCGAYQPILCGAPGPPTPKKEAGLEIFEVFPVRENYQRTFIMVYQGRCSTRVILDYWKDLDGSFYSAIDRLDPPDLVHRGWVLRDHQPEPPPLELYLVP